jgi:cation transport ATPase
MSEDYETKDFKNIHTTTTETVTVKKSLPHYYGDIIRKLFLVAGMIMLATLPFLHVRVSAPVFLSIVFILVLTFAAGFTNPRQKWNITINTVISLVGFSIFTFEAVTRFESIFDLLFATNMSLACLFLFAFYLSTKTLRGSYAYIPKAQKEEFFEVPIEKKDELEATHEKNPAFLTEEERRKKRFLND